MMPEQLSDAMNYLDDKYLNECEKQRRKRPWLLRSAAGIAACVCAAIPLLQVYQSAQVETINGLPVLTLDAPFNYGMGSGPDPYAHFISTNPWNENLELETLPVYQNMSYYKDGPDVYFSEKQMKKIAREVMDYFGGELVEDKTWYLESYEGHIDSSKMAEIGSATDYIAETTVGTIRVDSDGTWAMDLKPYLSLPEEYDYTAGYEEIECPSFDQDAVTRSSQYIYQEYLADLFGFEEIGLRRQEIYDASGDIVQDIVNYNLQLVTYGIYKGGISNLYYENYLACAEEVGNYPVITVEQAKELLLSGYYSKYGEDGDTQVGPALPEDTIIKDVTLTYSFTDNYYVPYYRFEISNQEVDDGMYHPKQYCFVPAIEAQYINGDPAYQGLHEYP